VPVRTMRNTVFCVRPPRKHTVTPIASHAPMDDMSSTHEATAKISSLIPNF
jgi:hypothetical protein